MPISMCLKQKVWLILFCGAFAGIESIRAQETILLSDSVVAPITQEPFDSMPYTFPDTISTDIQSFTDTIPTDTIPLAADTILAKSGMLEAPVTYQAKDSIVITAGNMAYLYGQGDVKYQQIQLQAERIEMSLDNNEVFAIYDVDSTGMEFGYPLYINGPDQQLEAKSIRYNFETQRAYAKNVLTEQGEGFLTARETKKMEDNTMFINNGQYSTCDEHEHPHFYIQLTKAKTRPGKDIVAGPIYLVIEDVPLPIGLPFAFFPFTQTYSSGIIMPTYGEDMTRGFFLQNGGYYFALSDYIDLSLIGDIYTKGTWQISARSSYRKRYKYNGNFDAGYQLTTFGDKGFDDYSVSKAYKINWLHTQDPKANPYLTLSASINFSANQFDRNELKGQTMQQTTENTKKSSLNITKRFPNSPLSITASMNISQISRDSTLSVTLPSLGINMSLISPFKRKNAIGPERWYEKIKLSYTGNLQNSVTSKESEFMKQNLIRDWRNAMNHQIPISATYSAFGYINITPSFNYTERWYTSKDIMKYDTEQRKLVTDTTLYGFYRVYNYNASISAGTTLYGFYKPWSIFGGFVNMIRHRMEPSVSYSMSPDFGDPRFGFWKDYSFVNNDIEVHGNYSPFSRGVFGVPSRGKQGNISFSVNNNFEAKIRSNQDSTGLKKISLIDNLSFGISYNLAVDTFQWSDSRVALRLKLTKSYTLNLSGVFDTYTYTYDEKNNKANRVNIPRWQVGKGIGRLKSTSSSLSYTFDNNTMKNNVVVSAIRKLFGGNDLQAENRTPSNHSNDFDEDETLSNQRQDTQTSGTRLRTTQTNRSGDYDDDGYLRTSIPWSINVSYSLSVGYDYNKFNPEKMEYDYILKHTLNFSGNLQPSEKWRINFSGNYDFDQKKIPYMRLTVSRDLHCFQMSANIVPVGYRKTYMFSIAVNSSLLKDLKYNQSSNYWNGQSWY